MEAICVIVGLLSVLAVVTVVGHGLWLLVAAVFRHSTTDQSSAVTAGEYDRRIQTDLAAARRLVGYARYKGWLSDDQINHLEELLEAFAYRQATGKSLQPTASKLAEPGVQAPVVSSRASVSETVESAWTPLQPPEAIPDASVLAPTKLEELTGAVEPILLAAAVERPTTPQPLEAAHTAHPLEEPEPNAAAVIKPVQPAKPPLSAELLRTFMERTNIRWIELVSAALIVVGSVGLVISLWNTLSATSRYFPSLVFLLATIAVHGAGQYTLRRWKLRSTSRGVLHIGLMLVPLAVLVGILLSRRSDQPPTLDGGTTTVLIVGTLVYSFLVVTACRALFVGRWLPVAAGVITGAASLVPIHFLAGYGKLLTSTSALVLVPLVLSSLVNALQLSRFASLPVISAGRTRRMASQVMQITFAAAVPCIFWIMQSKGIGLSQAAVAMSSALFAGWASWGWTASLKPILQRRADRAAATTTPLRSSAGLSWYVAVSWCLAAVCTLALAAIFLQVMDSRVLLSLTLLGLAAWWYLHGLQSGLLTSLAVATLAVIVGVSLVIEGALPGSHAVLEIRDWLTLPRVGLISLLGTLSAVMGAILLSSDSSKHTLATLISDSTGYRQSLPKLYVAWIGTGVVAILAAAGLTTLASLTKFSTPEYGGNWAPGLLMVYGILILSAAILRPAAVERIGFGVWLDALVPIGQATMLLAVVKLSHSAPWAPTWLQSLRPNYAWAVGTGVLSVVWSLVAAILGSRSRSDLDRGQLSSQFTLQWLGLGAVALSLVSAMVYWIRPDQLVLASQIGWVVPVVMLLAFIALRHSDLRESALLATAVWLSSALLSYGMSRHWWNDLGATASAGVLVVSILILLAAYWAWMNSDLGANRPWTRQGGPWASGLLLNASWLAVCSSLAVVGALELLFNLRDTQLPERFFLSAPLSPGRSGIVFGSLASLAIFTATIARKHTIVGTIWLATVPAALALLAACQITAPYGTPVFLWLLLIPAAVYLLVRRSTEVRGSTDTVKALLTTTSLPNAVGLSIIMLTLSTVAVWLFFGAAGLPLPLAPISAEATTWYGWLTNVGRLSIWNGPAWILLLGAWLVSLLGRQAGPRIIERGYLIGLYTTLISAVASQHLIPTITQQALNTFAVTMFILSGVCIGLITGRNWLGLRHLDRQSGAWTLLRKSCKGKRWRDAETDGFKLWIGSFAAVLCLSAISAAVVVLYPEQRLASWTTVGSLGSILTVAASLALGWIYGPSRNLSRFGMLAITLGLISPAISAGYAHWLVDYPAHRFLTAQNYEPYRLQLGLWLVALLVGLSIRIFSTITARPTSAVADACWVGLATIVGVLALLGWQDSNWSTGQLILLAIITAISSEASGKTWRGYAAALAALATWMPWISDGWKSGEWLFLWQVQHSLVGTAAVALLARSVLTRFRPDKLQLGRFAVDQAVVLSVSTISIGLSLVWAYFESAAIRHSWAVPSLLGMASLLFSVAIARIWQSQSKQRGLGIYLATLALTGVTVDVVCALRDISRVYNELSWWLGLLGAMTLMAVVLRAMINGNLPVQRWFGAHELATHEKLARASQWMSVLHTATALLCLLPSVWLVLTMSSETLRLAAIGLPLLGTAAILPVSAQRIRPLQRAVVLVLVSATLVLAWWADLPSAWALRQPHESWMFVQRAFLAFVLLGVVYPIVANLKVTRTSWIRSLITAGWICLSLAALTGIGMLAGAAMGHWDAFPATVSAGTKVMTILGWFVLFARMIAFAAWPLGPEKSATQLTRTAAVYAAEIAIALGVLAIRMHYPYLFNNGTFRNWWPVILFGVAFGSMAIGELLGRINLPILADPVRRSSLLLPAIPLFGVWALQPPTATLIWSDFGRFSVLLVIGSILYGIQSWMRGSLGLRALSGTLALLSFWSFLQSHPALRFFEHPQFWLLPPALSALMFVEWNKSRLESSVVTAVRYLSIIVAYLSSTSEVFFKAFAGSLWPPLLLLTLALCGVAAGILMRVRAFLFCGLVFVAVSLFGIVWHAARAIDQVWPWFAFVIVTGIGLFVLLGYFEKNRAQMLKRLEELKQWET